MFAHDTWLYSAAVPEGRLFMAGEEHPGGEWADSPATLAAMAAPDPLDHDGDRKKGGSKRRRAKPAK